MQEYQQRVVNEKSELDHKLYLLIMFLKGETFKALPSEEQERMQRQFVVMKEYSNILGERAAAFN